METWREVTQCPHHVITTIILMSSDAADTSSYGDLQFSIFFCIYKIWRLWYLHWKLGCLFTKIFSCWIVWKNFNNQIVHWWLFCKQGSQFQEERPLRHPLVINICKNIHQCRMSTIGELENSTSDTMYMYNAATLLQIESNYVPWCNS